MTRQAPQRSGGMSLGAVARDLGVPTAVLRPYVGQSLVPNTRGRYDGKAVAAFVAAHPELVPEHGPSDPR